MGVPEMDPLSQLSLPPGFRFFPTDEELMVKYLCPKIAGYDFSLQIIGEIDLYKFDPWILPSKAMFGEKEWYFFSPRDRKYPNGSRPNRVAASGYWKATGTDKIISSEGRKVGIKKALVFYIGKAPKGTKTNWIMHEYRLSEPSKKNGSSKLDDWVLCRIYKKNSGGQRLSSGIPTKEPSYGSPYSSSSSQYDDILDSLPEIEDRLFNFPKTDSVEMSQPNEKLNLHKIPSGNFDWASLVRLTSSPVTCSVDQTPCIQNNHNRIDTYVPYIPEICHSDSRFNCAEIKSEITTQRIDSGFFQHNNSGTYAPCFSNSFDVFGLSCPSQSETLMFRH